MNQRIYKVADNHDESRVALVRAGTPAQAVRHAVSNRFAVKVASQDELVHLVALGVKVETAGEEPSDES